MSHVRLRRAVLLSFVAGSVVLLAAATFLWAPRDVPQGQPALVHLGAGNLGDLRSAFNAASAGTRLLVLLSPT